MRHPCPDCKSSSGFVEYETTSYCFKCKKWTPKGYSGIYKSEGKVVLEGLRLPSKVVYNPQDMHPEALEWLFKYYVFEDMIKKYKIGYIPESHRVFLPLLDKDKKILYYINRALIPGDVKYLNSTGVKAPMYCIEGSKSEAIVLVEDFISTIRIGQHYNVAFLQGTSLSRELLKHIVENYKHVVTWLDSDAPGQGAARKIAKQIRDYEDSILETRIYTRPDRLEPTIIKNVCTEKDPKCHTDSEIKEILG